MLPELLREALARHTPSLTPFEAHTDRAAVALVIAGDGICFIRRAARAGDPWSGQMALPGGRASADDASAYDVAERETWEEVGLRLQPSHRLGALSELPVHRAGVETSTVLSPLVYHIGPFPTPLVPNHEVAEAYWIPLADLWDARNVARFREYPAIQFREHFIWGLTLRVLALFAEALGQPLPA